MEKKQHTPLNDRKKTNRGGKKEIKDFVRNACVPDLFNCGRATSLGKKIGKLSFQHKREKKKGLRSSKRGHETRNHRGWGGTHDVSFS